ncbi:uncharacterized protein LOC123517639 [Portunus trituberculatus]|uniref:uncharacterized protein LOC123517639 n=1 Tax=Portunus trituberculatus TaxID=210409 RepID=UPI001E1CD1BB|nr:uncharacterized protein LOC123517639 [Portunus trituberculatus]
MPLASHSQASLAMVLLLVLVIPVHLTQVYVSDAAQTVSQEEISEEGKIQNGTKAVREAVGKLLSEYNTVPLPGLPTFNINSDKISISISLANIYLQGLSDMKFLDVGVGMIKNKTVHGTVMFKKIRLLVGTYSSSGHINNLPFNGEGPMYIHLHDFSISFSIKWYFKPFSVIPCVDYNTSHLALDLLRMETHFDHLNANEGADLGQVVDIVVPSFGQDIVKELEFLLSTTYYEKLDTILVGLINIKTKCTKGIREDVLNTVQVMKMTQDIIKELIP